MEEPRRERSPERAPLDTFGAVGNSSDCHSNSKRTSPSVENCTLCSKQRCCFPKGPGMWRMLFYGFHGPLVGMSSAISELCECLQCLDIHIDWTGISDSDLPGLLELRCSVWKPFTQCLAQRGRENAKAGAVRTQGHNRGIHFFTQGHHRLPMLMTIGDYIWGSHSLDFWGMRLCSLQGGAEPL